MRKIAFYLLLLTLLSGCSTLHRIRSNKILASASLGSSVFYSEVSYQFIESLPYLTYG
ncbi:MAG: lipoprotein [Saprospirales bacterium]|nr:lipoprotein [Saprospirales bacterium]